jgi:hypothetical protein
MDGDCFQNTDMPDLHLSEAPFDGMDPQSNGAEIEQTTKRKKGPTKKGAYVGQESKPKSEEAEVLEREEYEIDGEIYVIEKIKMDGVDDNGNTSCWKGYKKVGTKKKGGKEVNDCVKSGDELEHDGEQLDEYGKVKKKKSKKYVAEKTLDKVDKKELKGSNTKLTSLPPFFLVPTFLYPFQHDVLPLSSTPSIFIFSMT